MHETKKRAREGLDGLPVLDRAAANWAFPMFGIIAMLLLSLCWGIETSSRSLAS